MAVTVCLLAPCMALSSENRGLDGLREQVGVLDQARQKAALELSVKEDQGIATDRDREHFRTVTTLLEQRIKDFCVRLAAQDGIVDVGGLPCPDLIRPAATRKEQEKKRPASDTVVQQADEKPAQARETEKQEELSAVAPEELAGARAEPEVMPSDQGFLAGIRQWWESLFLRKMTSSGNTTGEPEEAKIEEEGQQADTEVSSVQERLQRNAGSAQLEQPKPGDTQRAVKEPGNGREEKQEGSAEQAAAVSSEADRKPAGVDQGTQQRPIAGEDRQDQHSETGVEEVVGHVDDSKAVPGQERSLTGIAEKEGQGLPKRDGDILQHKDVPPLTTAAGTEQEHKPAQSGLAGVEVRRKTGAVPQSGIAAGSGTAAGVAGLEQSLQDALNAFDGKLLNEEEHLAARVPKQREGVAGSHGSSGGGMAGGRSLEGSGSQQGNGRTGAGGYGQAGSIATDGTQQPDTGAGRSSIDADDDIVARQLREAAEQETDPVLQEKLWQEYKKYKQGR